LSEESSLIYQSSLTSLGIDVELGPGPAVRRLSNLIESGLDASKAIRLVNRDFKTNISLDDLSNSGDKDV
jgi:hypothetical protein